MIWWILLGILALILLLPLGVRINYDEDGAVVSVLIRPFHIQVCPVKKTEKPNKKKIKLYPNKNRTLPYFDLYFQ